MTKPLKRLSMATIHGGLAKTDKSSIPRATLEASGRIAARARVEARLANPSIRVEITAIEAVP